MSSVVDQWTDDVAGRVLERLLAEDLPIQPKQVQITEHTDALGDDAWRVLLVLPAPAGETWDREAVFAARRAAISALESFAEDEGRALPGDTIAFVTTDEATDQDTATEDEPEPGEDPGRSS